MRLWTWEAAVRGDRKSLLAVAAIVVAECQSVGSVGSPSVSTLEVDRRFALVANPGYRGALGLVPNVIHVAGEVGLGV
jgi:hypothetical protein